MTSPQRLEFITRHFNDLQTIRAAPAPLAMLLAPALRRMPHLSRVGAWVGLLVFLSIVGGFYRWSTVAIRRRYGSVKVSNDEEQRRRPPVVKTLQLVFIVALTWCFFLAHRSYFWELYLSSTIFIGMLTMIVDSTNTTSRRIAWTIGLVVLFSAGPFLIGVDGGSAIFCLAGGIWLALSLFDFLLLRRTFAEIATNPPAAVTEGVVRYG